jgi:very-short-patch-repair endonuclease
LGGYKFTRQLPIGPYFADFACRKQKLVIEVDGSQHADSTYDRNRDEHFRALGYSTLRFWNHDVLKHRTSVCETILAARWATRRKRRGERPALCPRETHRLYRRRARDF